MSAHEDDTLPDFEDDAIDQTTTAVTETKKGNYIGIHASGFRDFLLKAELQRAIVDCGFEHPSEVQHECIPQAILGTDVLCQAKSGMGKTAVFVLASLQSLDESSSKQDVVEKHKDGTEKKSTRNTLNVVVVVHARELAFQIKREYDRFAKYFPWVKIGVVFGGIPIQKDREMLGGQDSPHILIGTPGRLLQLVKENDINMDHVKQFILDECDKCLDKPDMRKDVQQIFIKCPKKKQVMMFSATMDGKMRELCKKFMHEPHEIRVDEDRKLTLHGLLQYYVKLDENQKNRKLVDLLDVLQFNQVIIFVKSVQRAIALDKLLNECSFPSITVHSKLEQDERIGRYKLFKEFQKRIMVATDLMGRGIDIEKINVVINYDMPTGSPKDKDAIEKAEVAEEKAKKQRDYLQNGCDQYLHRVGRAGRFGTKGLAISFCSGEEDTQILNGVQERFEVQIDECPEQIDPSSYLNA